MRIYERGGKSKDLSKGWSAKLRRGSKSVVVLGSHAARQRKKGFDLLAFILERFWQGILPPQDTHRFLGAKRVYPRQCPRGQGQDSYSLVFPSSLLM